MEQTYKDWEKAVTNMFYTKAHTTNTHLQLPKDGKPLYAYKDKIMLVVNFICPDGIDMLSKTVHNKPDIPKKEHVMVYHIGNKKMEGVSSGLKGDEVSFPGIDVGGLTTYRQIVGTPALPGMKPKKIHIGSNVSQKTIDAIYKTWKTYAGKDRFYGNVKEGIMQAIRSINKDAYIQFYKVPKEHRVIYTSMDVYNATGHYYNRLFGNPKYAQTVKPNKTQYIAISDAYITPNINRNNIMNEYTV